MTPELAKLIRGGIWSMEPQAWQDWLVRVQDREEAPEPPELAEQCFVPGDLPVAKLEGVATVAGKVAVVPISGVIGKDFSYWVDVSAEALSALVARLMADPDIGAIVFDIDSPGGYVFGVPELSAELRGWRGIKPMYSVASGMMASAAYWLGSATDKVLVSPSSLTGSIGVWCAHIDVSKAMEEIGYKVTLISAGKYKVEGNPYEPLSEEAHEAMLTEVQSYYDQFVADVAKQRNRRETTVRSGFGEGRVLPADRAVDEHLADGVATLQQVVGSLLPKKTSGRSASARARLAIEQAY